MAQRDKKRILKFFYTAFHFIKKNYFKSKEDNNFTFFYKSQKIIKNVFKYLKETCSTSVLGLEESFIISLSVDGLQLYIPVLFYIKNLVDYGSY